MPSPEPPLPAGKPGRGGGTGPDALCLGLLAALTASFFWRCLFTRAVFLPADLTLRFQPWRAYARALFPDFRWVSNPMLDPILLFYPWRVYAAKTLHAGLLPLWNPHSFCGQPFLANNSSAVLYPPNVLFLLMAPARAYGWSAALHVFLAGAFTFLFLRLLGLRRAACVLGSVVFMFCGFLTVWAEYLTPVAASIWLPLALFFWERHARGHGRRFAIYAAAPLGLSVLGGHAQYSAYVLLFFGLYAGWRAGFQLRPWMLAGGVAALGLALAGGQLLPTAELGKYSHRSGGLPLATVLAQAMPFRHLVTFLVPNFYGNIRDYNYWGDFNFVERCGYLGILPLLLAPVALWRRPRGHTLFFTAAAAVTLLMILGTPLYAPLYYLLPGFKQLGSPARMLNVFSLAVACLAAIGADALGDLEPRRRRALAGIAGGCVALGVTAIGAWYLASSDAIALAAAKVKGSEEMAGVALAPYVEHAIEVSLGLLLVAGAAMVAAAGRRRAIWLLAGLVAADLFLFGMRFNPAADPDMLFFPTESLHYLHSQPGPFRVLALASDEDFMNGLVPNCNLPVGLSEVQGSDAIYPRRYAEFAGFAESRRQGKPVSMDNGLRFTSPDTPFVDLLGVRYVLSPYALKSPHLREVCDADGQPSADGWRPRSFLHVYRDTNERPRAFLVHRARVEPAGRVLETMAAEGAGLRETAILESPQEGVPAAPHLPAAPAAGPESARLIAVGPNSARVEVQASSEALLVLADQAFPGWHASVDGRPAPLYTADYVLRAVPVPAGRHTVSFDYRPASFRLGLYLSLLALSLLVATVVRAGVKG